MPARNPLIFDGASFSWSGRELTQYEKDGKTISFQYDENGLRHRKTITENDVITEQYDYVWSDGTLISQTYTNFAEEVTTSDTARFIYDSWGTLQGFILNDSETYLYVKNLQGDIIAIVDEKGQTIVEYSYDAWGQVTFHETSLQNMTKASTLCFVSPFTYRGYCYDYDIELYYLQSRYYSAEIGRFINADSTDYLGITGTVLSFNLFAYCENNAVVNVDYTGYYGISNLLSIFNQSLGLIQNIIELIANSCAKELNALKQTIKKLTKKQKNYVKLLDDVVKESNKIANKLGKIGKIITLVTVIVGLIEVLNKGAKRIFAFAKLLAELCTEAITAFASKICGFIAARVPGFGFILNVIVSFGVSYMLSKFFTDSRVSKIANRIHNSIKNIKTINKSNLFKTVLKSAFA